MKNVKKHEKCSGRESLIKKTAAQADEMKKHG
jgi:hypothetical protein